MGNVQTDPPEPRGAESTTGNTTASSLPPRTDRLVSIDILRALAALSVLFFHIGIQPPAFIPEGLRFWVMLPIEYGWAGVPIFIVLSGFCIHVSTARRMAAGLPARADWIGFWKRRFWRLYPAYFVVVMLSVGLYFVLGAERFPADQRITNLPFDVATHLLLIHNLFRDYCIGLGNGSFWTLGLEEQLYGLYVVYLLFRRGWSAGKVLLVATSVSVGWHVMLWCVGVSGWYPAPSWPDGPLALGRWPQWPFGWWMLWVLGAFAAEGYVGATRFPRWFGSPILALAVAGLAVAVSIPFATKVLHQKDMIPAAASELLFGVAAFCVLNWWLRREAVGGFRSFPARCLAGIGLMSYSLYLVHLPVLVTIRTMLPYGPVRFVVSAVAALVVAALLFATVERWSLKQKSRKREAPPATPASG